MERNRIHTGNAPKAVGPYSQAITIGDLVYTAGQIGLNPETMELVDGGLAGQVRRALENLKAVLEAADSDMGHVVKTTVFLQDMGDFAEMNGIYAEYFTGEPPARSAVEVAALPLGALFEIEAVAVRA